jgi:hypothetical protein
MYLRTGDKSVAFIRLFISETVKRAKTSVLDVPQNASQFQLQHSFETFSLQYMSERRP